MNQVLDVSTFNAMMNAVTTSANAVSTLVGEVNLIKTSINDLRADVDAIKNTSEITYEQRRVIRQSVKARVYTALELPLKKSEWKLSDKVCAEKYLSLFFSRCYSEVAKLGHLATPYGLTTKENYDYALRDIEAWSPAIGVAALKKEADENTEIRRLLR